MYKCIYFVALTERPRDPRILPTYIFSVQRLVTMHTQCVLGVGVAIEDEASMVAHAVPLEALECGDRSVLDATASLPPSDIRPARNRVQHTWSIEPVGSIWEEKRPVSALLLSRKKQEKSPSAFRSWRDHSSGSSPVPERATAWFSPRPYDVVSPDFVSWHHLGDSRLEKEQDGRITHPWYVYVYVVLRNEFLITN